MTREQELDRVHEGATEEAWSVEDPLGCDAGGHLCIVQEIDWREAESITGHRVDRRRAYARDDGQLLELCRGTISCSGCCESGEYGGLLHLYEWDAKAGCHVGGGCSECGHTGKRRLQIWVPYSPVKGGRHD